MNPNPPESVSVACLLPFFRYAVGPICVHSPAIPFYRLSSARAFLEQLQRELPWASVTLYKRRYLGRTIETIEIHLPHPDCFETP